MQENLLSRREILYKTLRQNADRKQKKLAFLRESTHEIEKPAIVVIAFYLYFKETNRGQVLQGWKWGVPNVGKTVVSCIVSDDLFPGIVGSVLRAICRRRRHHQNRRRDRDICRITCGRYQPCAFTTGHHGASGKSPLEERNVRDAINCGGLDGAILRMACVGPPRPTAFPAFYTS
jgi:hypothetical protein